MKLKITPNNTRRDLGSEDFIVTKTDTKGRITYANRIFMDIAGLSESELLGVQHNIIRHPDMPRGVFNSLWETLKAGNEFFGFVKNLCSDGGYYWVFANITPDYDKDGKLQGYYSVRRQPPQSALDILMPVYKEMLTIESTGSKKESQENSIAYLNGKITQAGAKSYEKFVLNLYKPSGV
ncbi:MAG: PAS domain-containing protein [Methylococcaceae bacterium]|nr:PAS domain-containing protein [Methylococcaceae bacterium]